MMTAKPEIVLTTYDELRQTARKFVEGRIPLMVLVGSPGLGKTQVLEGAYSGLPYLKVDGKKAPLDLYVDLFRHLDQPVLLDDVDTLLDNKDGQVLIRQLTDTKPLRGVSWGTRTKILDTLSPPVPRFFHTRSPVCVIANRWRSTGIFGAIESRATLFRFKPSWAEAYEYAGQWFDDQEVLDYVHAHLGVMTNPDLRLLRQAVTVRSLGLMSQDWRQLFDSCIAMDRVQAEVERLLSLKISNAERARLFTKGGFGDRATFYRRLAKRPTPTPQALPQRIVVTAGSATACPVAKEWMPLPQKVG
jgi:hypothetical protein